MVTDWIERNGKTEAKDGEPGATEAGEAAEDDAPGEEGEKKKKKKKKHKRKHDDDAEEGEEGEGGATASPAKRKKKGKGNSGFTKTCQVHSDGCEIVTSSESHPRCACAVVGGAGRVPGRESDVTTPGWPVSSLCFACSAMHCRS
jgi:hypothetical protein